MLFALHVPYCTFVKRAWWWSIGRNMSSR